MIFRAGAISLSWWEAESWGSFILCNMYCLVSTHTMSLEDQNIERGIRCIFVVLTYCLWSQWGRRTHLLAWAFWALSYSRPYRSLRMSRWWCNSVSASAPCLCILNGFITHLLEKWFSIKWFNKCFIRRISIASMLAAVTFFYCFFQEYWL